MKTQRIKTLLLFLSMIPFIGIYAQSIYYVSPHASSGGDGSQSAPFHSIHEAVEKARKDQNSTTIYLREGKYVLDNKELSRRENRTVEWDCTGLEMGEI